MTQYYELQQVLLGQLQTKEWQRSHASLQIANDQKESQKIKSNVRGMSSICPAHFLKAQAMLNHTAST